MAKPHVYRFLLLNRSETAWVCEVLHHNKLVHTTDFLPSRSAAYSAAMAWVASLGKEAVKESSR